MSSVSKIIDKTFTRMAFDKKMRQFLKRGLSDRPGLAAAYSASTLWYLPLLLYLRHLHVASLKSKSQPKLASCQENNYVWTEWFLMVKQIQHVKFLLVLLPLSPLMSNCKYLWNFISAIYKNMNLKLWDSEFHSLLILAPFLKLFF